MKEVIFPTSCVRMWYQRLEKPDGTFFYLDVDRQTEVTAQDELDRIEEMRIPKAYQNVMIHKNRRAKVQAYGYDARGRKQVMYASWFVQKQANKKYAKVLVIDEYMPKLIERMKHDIGRTRDTVEKQVAVVLYLMIACGFRIGNEKYLAENKSYGITTLEVRHVRVSAKDKSIRIEFIGKKGVHNASTINHDDAPLIYAFLKKAVRNKAKEDRVFTGLSSDDVNAYLRHIHPDMTSKDIRTWNANNIFLSQIMNASSSSPSCRAKSVAHVTRAINVAVDKVAQHLHHTRDVCKKNYLHPDFMNFARIVVVHRGDIPSISQALP